ncbi:MAG: (2Fe-2S)-binding protein [Bacteroidota bacterium]
MSSKITVTLKVNGDLYEVAVKASKTLVEVLREDLHLMGTKIGCQTGDCGACTILLDGKSVCSCLTLAVEAQHKEITTIEGLAPHGDELHPIQEAFVKEGAIQCGYCTPGMVMSVKHLLDKNPRPSELEIRQGLSGNLCRCTGYGRIVKAVQVVSETMNESLKEL